MSPILIPLLPILATVLFLVAAKRSWRRLPPGPKGLPLLGNVLGMPKSHEWIQYMEWSRKYKSDIISLNLAGTTIIILNSARAAVDLFEKRSSLYSDRTHDHAHVGWGFNFSFIGYGDEWREHRRVFHQHFNSSAIAKYRPRVTREVRACLGRFLDQPDGFMAHLRHMAGSLILSVTYGIEVLPDNDPYIATAEEAMHALAVCGNAGAYLVDYIPFLRHLPDWAPGAGFKRQAAEWRKPTLAMGNEPFSYVKRTMAEGAPVPSFVSSLLVNLEGIENRDKQEKIIRNAAGAAYAGGADTSVSAIGTFILAMVVHPEVQCEAQQELDRVLGGNRLPELEDGPDLPYVTAILREVLRWRLVTPLGEDMFLVDGSSSSSFKAHEAIHIIAAPHRLTTDDEYQGYFLPAGSLVVGNAWAILHDEVQYPEPDSFNPNRYLTAEGQLDPAAPNPEAFAFGFGRRACPGRYLAIQSIWLSIASILATLDISKARDQDDKVIEPSVACTSGLVSYPAPFRCSIRPRSNAAATLIRSHSSYAE